MISIRDLQILALHGWQDLSSHALQGWHDIPNLALHGWQDLSDRALQGWHAVPDLALQGLQIVWINLLLSGDNAVVIALACRALDKRRRKWAIAGGSIVAIGLRIVLTFFLVALLGFPFVKLLSGTLLLWIALRLLRDENGEHQVAAAGSIWEAVRTIAIADVVMSLDNVVAVAAAAKGSIPLIVFGIALTIPLIVFGSTLILSLLQRFPILVLAGAALLGWVAGNVMSTDPLVADNFGHPPGGLELWFEAALAAGVLAIAGTLRLARHRTTN